MEPKKDILDRLEADTEGYVMMILDKDGKATVRSKNPDIVVSYAARNAKDVLPGNVLITGKTIKNLSEQLPSKKRGPKSKNNDSQQVEADPQRNQS